MTAITATELVLRESISCKAKQIYTYLAHRSNRENTCFPGLKRIAKECGMSLSSVQRALNELVSEGLLKKLARYRYDGSQTTNLYVLIEEIEEKAMAKEEAIKAKIAEKEKAEERDNEKQIKICEILNKSIDFSAENQESNARHKADHKMLGKDSGNLLLGNKAVGNSLICKNMIGNFIKKSEFTMLNLQLKAINFQLKGLKIMKKSLRR